MNRIQSFSMYNDANEVNENEVMELVQKLGYNSIDEIKKEKNKLAKLESLLKEIKTKDGTKADTIEEEQCGKGKKKVEEDDENTSLDGEDTTSGSGDSSTDTTSTSGEDTTSGSGETSTDTTSTDTTSGSGDSSTDTTSTSGEDTTSGSGDSSTDTTSTSGDDSTSEPTQEEPVDDTPKAAKHIKSFAEFCGETDECSNTDDKKDNVNESKVQVKRKYTENHPAMHSYENMKIRNAVMSTINKNGGFLVDEDLNTLFKSKGQAKQWFKNNAKYIEVTEEEGKMICKYTKKGTRLNNILNGPINEGEVKSDDDFREYAMKVLKQAHKDDFDEDTANDVIDGLIDKYKEDYGAMVGALNSGLAEEANPLTESKIESEEEFRKYATDRLKMKHKDNFDEDKANQTIDGLLDKYGDNYGAMVGALK